MSTIEKSKASNLEGEKGQEQNQNQDQAESFDFGNSELNDTYRKLDKKTKEEFDKIPKKDVQIELLKTINDPLIQEIYKGLNETDKAKVDKLKVRDKYLILKQLAKQRKSIKSSQEEKPQAQAPIVSQQQPEEVQQEEQEEQEDDEPVIENRPQKPQERVNRPNISIQQQIDRIIQTFYSADPFVKSRSSVPELEVRFATKGKPMTKTDYDNVIKKLKSLKFNTVNSNGEYYLRMNSEFLDSDGKFKVSNIRAEVVGLHNIQHYCKNNDIKELIKTNFSCVSFIKKSPVFINGTKIFPVDSSEFNFRISYVNEDEIKTGVKNSIIDGWKKNKKQFRFINRVSFTNENYPFRIDLSIVKQGSKEKVNFGRDIREQIKPEHTLEQSKVFTNSEAYEIEIEVLNNSIGPGTKFNTPELIASSLRNMIKNILGGLQGTNFPVSYPEQHRTRLDYMRLIWGKDFDETKGVQNRNFIGPSSITLQVINLADNNDNSHEPNIRKDFVVTEKADGDRHLMYINHEGKIYLINTNMNVIFTGAKSLNPDYFETLLDGELILHDKNKKFINLYAAFDIYFVKKVDVRGLTFMPLKEELNILKSRYYLLKDVISRLKAVSILDEGKKEALTAKERLQSFVSTTSTSTICPIRIVSKEFFPLSSKQTIFGACDTILSKAKENRFEYETDGLIFTHAYFGVGSEKVGESGPKTKITWRQSFKWKPPKYNTIDFLITTLKGENGNDIVKPIFEDGISTDASVQLTEYKTIQLRCGFSEKNDGYINPCQDIIDDKLPEFKQRFEDKKEKDYLPKQFYPTEPYDPEAGICRIILKIDGSGKKQMFTEENEVFNDDTIVEFSYDFTKEKGWRWSPLRVRNDKTAEYRKGENQYGNSYKTANENWKSIHNPVTEAMICSGVGIPDILVSEDVYYNKPSGELMTEAMKNFHNLYVKKMLIKSVAKPGDTLVDMACGKAGDLPKWISARLSFVFGIDYSKENLENRIDGACARYLNSKKINKIMPSALFVHGNSAYNIKKGDAMLNDKAKQITAAVFGMGTKESDKIGKGVAKHYGVGEDGFNVTSCQFALHYFLESPDALQGFVRNVAECTKLNGYFIGTAYDGKEIFKLLQKTKVNESQAIIEDGKKIWEITKRYSAETFEDDSSSIGYKIDIYQESINQTISEYLINFDYFDRIMEVYGFKIVPRDEAVDMGLPEGSGSFRELFRNMDEEIKRNKFKEKDYGDALKMKAFEKKISFLNRYFVYKKMIEVNTQKVEIELGEYNETEALRSHDVPGIQGQDQEQDQEPGKELEKEGKKKPKVRKLSKKLFLIAATEALEEEELNKQKQQDEPAVENEHEPTKSKKGKEPKIKRVKTEKPKKKLIIQQDNEEK
jgi:hypothetical protein